MIRLAPAKAQVEKETADARGLVGRLWASALYGNANDFCVLAHVASLLHTASKNDVWLGAIGVAVLPSLYKTYENVLLSSKKGSEPASKRSKTLSLSNEIFQDTRAMQALSAVLDLAVDCCDIAPQMVAKSMYPFVRACCAALFGSSSYKLADSKAEHRYAVDLLRRNAAVLLASLVEEHESCREHAASLLASRFNRVIDAMNQCGEASTQRALIRLLKSIYAYCSSSASSRSFVSEVETFIGELDKAIVPSGARFSFDLFFAIDPSTPSGSAAVENFRELLSKVAFPTDSPASSCIVMPSCHAYIGPTRSKNKRAMERATVDWNCTSVSIKYLDRTDEPISLPLHKVSRAEVGSSWREVWLQFRRERRRFVSIYLSSEKARQAFARKVKAKLASAVNLVLPDEPCSDSTSCRSAYSLPTRADTRKVSEAAILVEDHDAVASKDPARCPERVSRVPAKSSNLSCDMNCVFEGLEADSVLLRPNTACSKQERADTVESVAEELQIASRWPCSPCPPRPDIVTDAPQGQSNYRETSDDPRDHVHTLKVEAGTSRKFLQGHSGKESGTPNILLPENNEAVLVSAVQQNIERSMREESKGKTAEPENSRQKDCDRVIGTPDSRSTSLSREPDSEHLSGRRTRISKAKLNDKNVCKDQRGDNPEGRDREVCGKSPPTGASREQGRRDIQTPPSRPPVRQRSAISKKERGRRAADARPNKALRGITPTRDLGESCTPRHKQTSCYPKGPQKPIVSPRGQQGHPRALVLESKHVNESSGCSSATPENLSLSGYSKARSKQELDFNAEDQLRFEGSPHNSVPNSPAKSEILGILDHNRSSTDSPHAPYDDGSLRAQRTSKSPAGSPDIRVMANGRPWRNHTDLGETPSQTDPSRDREDALEEAEFQAQMRQFLEEVIDARERSSQVILSEAKDEVRRMRIAADEETRAERAEFLASLRRKTKVVLKGMHASKEELKACRAQIDDHSKGRKGVQMQSMRDVRRITTGLSHTLQRCKRKISELEKSFKDAVNVGLEDARKRMRRTTKSDTLVQGISRLLSKVV